MAVDPFADEAQTETPAESPWEDNTVTKTSPAPVVVPASEGKLVATFKGGSRSDSPWLVVHATDMDDLEETLSDGPRLFKLLERIKRIGATFAGAEASSGGETKSNGGQRGKPAGADRAPSGDTKTCAHGEMTFRSGVGKNGKTWKAFFCPAPKGASDQCDPEWIR